LVALQGGKYYACVDKNGDGDFEDFGESSSNDLTIITAQKENNTAIKEEINEESNETGEEVLEEITTNKTVSEEKITGEAVGSGLTQKITESGGFLVLLEVTLLLILFVLVMILFRLKPAASKEED
jgi:preprotein translocase subunit SecF